MKIYIGITHESENIESLVRKFHGRDDSLTKVGPFASALDAFNWLSYLKSRIGDFEEILPEKPTDAEELWYGFTFELSAS